MNVGDLVRRKPYKGVLNSLHSPAYYGIIVKVIRALGSAAEYDGVVAYKVSFIRRDGKLEYKTLTESDLEPISKVE